MLTLIPVTTHTIATDDVRVAFADTFFDDDCVQ